MNKIIVPAVFLLLISSKAFAALTIIQHVNVDNVHFDDSPLVVLTVTATGSGNLLVVAAANDGGRAVTGISDGTNNFTQFPSAHASGDFETDVWYLPKSTTGKTTITVTFAGSPGDDFYRMAEFWEVSGFTNPATDGANVVNFGVQAGGIATGASVTTTSTLGFVVGIDITASSVTDNPLVGNEFTSGGDIAPHDNAACSLISVVAGAHQPQWGDNGAGFTSSTAAFKESTSTYSRIQGVSTIGGVSTIN